MPRYWVPHQDKVWVCAQQVGPGTYSIDGVYHTFPEEEAKNFVEVRESEILGIPQLSDLQALHEAAVLSTLDIRYRRLDVYTYAGNILIAVNPYKHLSIYTAAIVDRYSSNADGSPPHIFATAHAAVRGMQLYKKSQSVLLYGESGAGKTESAKLVLQFLAHRSADTSASQLTNQSHSISVDAQLLRCQPVLEAFGNAKTVCNDNSSRFSKWMKTFFCPRGQTIAAASIHDYFVDTTRVVTQAENESNYHVFYLLLEGLRQHHPYLMANGEPIFEDVCYKFLRPSTSALPLSYNDFIESLTGLGFSGHEIRTIFAYAVGVLLLGNVSFEKGATLTIEHVARLWGVDSHQLRNACLQRSIKVGRDVAKINNSPARVDESVEAIAKWAYSKLFQFVLRHINTVLGDEPRTGPTIGILDISGFENVPSNSLEQLFINLASEKMQQHFNNEIFKTDLNDYRLELSSTFDFSQIQFEDNEDVLQLFEGTHPPGLLALLDEEALAPTGSDDTFLSGAVAMFANHPRYEKTKNRAKDFTVKHYAGDVTYAVEGLTIKNVAMSSTTLDACMESIFSQATIPLVCEMVHPKCSTQRRKHTVATMVKNDLRMLITAVEATTSHFVQCIRPNRLSSPGVVDHQCLREEVASLSIVETLHIRRVGYPLRMPFDDFFFRYFILIPPLARSALLPRWKPFLRSLRSRSGSQRHRLVGPRNAFNNPEIAEQGLNALIPALQMKGLAKYPVKPRDFVVGKTKILCSDVARQLLEDSRVDALHPIATTIQKVYKGYKWRTQMKRVREIFRHLNDIISRYIDNDCPKLRFGNHDYIQHELHFCDEVIAKACGLLVDLPNVTAGRRARQRLAHISDVYFDLTKCMQSYDVVFLQQSLARAQGLPNVTFDHLVPSVAGRLEMLKVQVPLMTALRRIKEDLDANDTVDLLEGIICYIEDTNLVANPTSWVFPNGDELYHEAKEMLAKLKSERRTHKTTEDQSMGDTESRFSPANSPSLSRRTCTTPLSRGRTTMFSSLSQEKLAFDDDPYRMKDQSLSVECGASCSTKFMQQNGERKTVTGMAREEQVDIENKLRHAVEEYDVETIKNLLGDAAKHGMELKDRFPHIVDQFHSLQIGTRVRNLLRQTLDEPPSYRRTQRLHSLLNQADVLGVSDDKDLVLAQLREIEELNDEVSLGDIYQLKNYPKLRPEMALPGTQLRSVAGYQVANTTLEYQNRPLQLSLLAFNEEPLIKDQLRHLALQCFRNILGYCGDLPSLYPETLVYEILDDINAYHMLRDEVYCQLMKQLTCNPSAHSEQHCWQLMLLVLRSTRPSASFTPYVQHFFETRAACGAALECLVELMKHTSRKTTMTRPTTPLLQQNAVDLAAVAVITPAEQIHAEIDVLQLQLANVEAQPQYYEDARLWGDAGPRRQRNRKPHLDPRALERFTYGVPARLGASSWLADVIAWMTCTKCRHRDVHVVSATPAHNTVAHGAESGLSVDATCPRPFATNSVDETASNVHTPTAVSRSKRKNLTVHFSKGLDTLASSLLEEDTRQRCDSKRSSISSSSSPSMCYVDTSDTARGRSSVEDDTPPPLRRASVPSDASTNVDDTGNMSSTPANCRQTSVQEGGYDDGEHSNNDVGAKRMSAQEGEGDDERSEEDVRIQRTSAQAKCGNETRSDDDVRGTRMRAQVASGNTERQNEDARTQDQMNTDVKRRDDKRSNDDDVRAQWTSTGAPHGHYERQSGDMRAARRSAQGRHGDAARSNDDVARATRTSGTSANPGKTIEDVTHDSVDANDSNDNEPRASARSPAPGCKESPVLAGA